VIIVVCKQARSKPSESGGGHVNQKGQSTPTLSAKNQGKNGQKTGQKPPSAQKGQVKGNAPNNKNGKKQKKPKVYDLVITIDLVSNFSILHLQNIYFYMLHIFAPKRIILG
jgi:hypothetical protein